MAIKDLNNKKTGDKLYASEWNDVMNEILAHFKNKRIHEDIVVTTGDENLLIYKDTNDVEHQFVLYPKEGTTYGELFILNVNNSQLDEYNVYNINNVSSEENTINFEVSYSRAVNIDGRIDHYETTGATITALELPQGLSVIGTPTDSTISIKIPENQEYNTKNYQFSIKVSMDPEHEDAQNTKTFTVSLTQNAKDATYSDPQLEVELNSELSTAIDTENKLKSSGGELVFNVSCTQQYGSETLTITDGITATIIDNDGNTLISSYSEGKIIIIIPRNDYTTDISYSTFEINATANGKSATPWIPETSYIQNKVIITYSNPNTITLSYSNYPQAGSSNGILPSYSFKVDKNYDNGRSQEQNVPFNQSSTIPTGIQLTFNKESGSATVTSSTGKVVTTNSNTSYQPIEIAKITLTVITGEEDSETSQATTVMQLGLTTPDLIYGGISVGGNDGVFAYTVQTLPNLLNEQLLDGNSFIKLDNNSTPKYQINTDIQNTINLQTQDDDMVVVYLLKDTTKNISVYDSTAEGYYQIPGTTDPIPYNQNFVISNGTYNYKGTTYKLIMIPTENKSLNYIIKIS